MRAAASYYESTDCKTLITPFKTDKPDTTKTTYFPSPQAVIFPKKKQKKPLKFSLISKLQTLKEDHKNNTGSIWEFAGKFVPHRAPRGPHNATQVWPYGLIICVLSVENYD